jgi:hypothetical protein
MQNSVAWGQQKPSRAFLAYSRAADARSWRSREAERLAEERLRSGFAWLGSVFALLTFVEVAAGAPGRVVVWLSDSDVDTQAMERALRLELNAKQIALLTAELPRTQLAAAEPPVIAADSAPELANRTLVDTAAQAVFWLVPDRERPVLWLRVLRAGSDVVEQVPLPNASPTLDPDLFAIAAASLLDQVLFVERSAGAAPAASASTIDMRPRAVAISSAAKEPAPTAPNRPASSAPGEPNPPEPAAPRWFAQAGFLLATAMVRSGLRADNNPPANLVFNRLDGVGGAAARLIFNSSTAWVSDADSFDDYDDPSLGIPRGVTSRSADCKADGIRTGPTDIIDPHTGRNYTTITPSSYCARVDHPTFVPIPALRFALGYWAGPRLALSLQYQWHYGIQPHVFFGSSLIRLQAELALAGRREAMWMFSLVGGASMGRASTPVTGHFTGRTNALTGPAGIDAGALGRCRFDERFALVLSPTVGYRFPIGQLTADVLLGLEGLFDLF